jgi:very-short-patch-repair endonuclease
MDNPKMKGPLSLRGERDRERESTCLLARAHPLRRQSSNAERVLWRHLRARRLMGYRFRRQVVIGPCIVDFACLEAGLIIEADGGQHSDQVACDTRRTVQLEGMGYRVMRSWNHEVPGELQHVLEQIRAALIEAPSPHPSPGGEGVRRYCQPTNFPEEPSTTVLLNLPHHMAPAAGALQQRSGDGACQPETAGGDRRRLMSLHGFQPRAGASRWVGEAL